MRGNVEVDGVYRGELRGVIRVQVVVDAGAKQSTSLRSLSRAGKSTDKSSFQCPRYPLILDVSGSLKSREANLSSTLAPSRTLSLLSSSPGKVASS